MTNPKLAAVGFLLLAPAAAMVTWGQNQTPPNDAQFGVFGSPYPPGQTKVNPTDGLKYVWIPPGRFMMGCSPGDNECGDEEKPAHPVTISKGFWIGQTPVTVGAYKRFVSAARRNMPPEPNKLGGVGI